MTYDQIIRDIERKIFAPVYFLMGEEPFFIDKIVSLLEDSILDESMKGFNQTIVYGRDVVVKDIIDLSRRYPMMGNYQVVIVKEAQYVDKIEEIESYIKEPLTTTILIISYKYKKIDKRTAFYKKLDKTDSVVSFVSEKIKDWNIPKWIEAQIKSMGFTISPVALMLIAEYLGNDLGKINNELEKLSINLPAGSTITEQEVEDNIGISKDFNFFELQNALVERDALKAHRIINYFEANPKDHPLFMIAPVLHNYFIKVFKYHQVKSQPQNTIASELGVHPFLVKDYVKAGRVFPPGKIVKIISDIRELDMKSKGVDNLNTQSYGFLKEIVFKMLN